MKNQNKAGVYALASLPLFVAFGLMNPMQEPSSQEKPRDARYSSEGGKHERHVDAAFKKALAASRISLSQAISAAETQTKGKAYDACVKPGGATSSSKTTDGMDNTSMTTSTDKLIVEVCVIAGDKLWKVQVDENGKVLNSQEKKEDGMSSDRSDRNKGENEKPNDKKDH